MDRTQKENDLHMSQDIYDSQEHGNLKQIQQLFDTLTFSPALNVIFLGFQWLFVYE